MTDTAPRPTSDDDREGWRAYWAAQDMPWRTEPEIDEERQRFLAERRAVKPDIEKGIYPFRDENGGIKLTRADVEWLLGMHESAGINGPVDWTDETQQGREGLDLRGADLRSQDLGSLPLARLIGGHAIEQMSRERPENQDITADQGRLAAIHLEKARLSGVHLEGAILNDACLEQARLGDARLEHAQLIGANLEGAFIWDAHLEHACLAGARLEEAELILAHLDHAQLSVADLKKASIASASLRHAHLDETHLEEADLSDADLTGADLREAYLDGGTKLTDVTLGSESTGPFLADVHWNDAHLAVIQWTEVVMLGDEWDARQSVNEEWRLRRILGQGRQKDRTWRLKEVESADRANRQLASALRQQGLNRYADHFAFRAQIMDRRALILQRHYLRAFGSWLLDLTSGYGYRPLRSVLTYLVVVLGFAAAYFLLRDNVHPALSPVDAVVFSITSFHGRGFSPGESVTLHNPLTIFAAFEAIIGLLIEISFIATFTQRFFAR